MTDFLKELTDLFTEKEIPNIIKDFTKSSFFRDHYLTQTFKINEEFHKKKIREQLNNKDREPDQNEINRIYENIKPTLKSLRFKKKSFYLKDGYPIQLNEELTKKLKRGEEIKVVTDNNEQKRVDNKIYNFKKGKSKVNFSSNLKPSNITLQETKELKMFINGSNENTSQFETWSAEKMYKEWLLLRLSEIEKKDWPIMKYVFFLFINQISCILNSYILYGNINDVLEEEAYKSYLEKLDEFTKNDGLYKDLLEVHLSFCKWYDIRIKSDTRQFKKRLVKINDIDNHKLSSLFRKSEKQIVAYRNVTHDNVKNTKRNNNSFFTLVEKTINELFKYTLNSNNYSMLIFTSYFQTVEKFNRLYAFPIFPILGIPFKTHDGQYYSAIGQVWHDYLHLNPLIEHFKYLYPYEINSNKKIDDIQVFFKKMLFLLKLDEKKESNNAKNLLWWILHEQSFLYTIKLENNETSNYKKRYKLFFDINTLIKVLLTFKNIIENGSEFCIGIHKNRINSSNSNYPTILSCIELLIEVCNETLDDSNKNKLLNKIINETEQFYNKNNLNNRYAVYGNNNNEYRKSIERPRFNSSSRNQFYNIALGNRNGSPLTNTNFSN